MKKLIYSVFTLLALSSIIAGCSGDSYEKRVKSEKKAINNYIADKGISVIYNYPPDHKFEKNQFFLEGSTGVYLRVESTGNLDDSLRTGERVTVYIRFDSVSYLVQDSSYMGNNYPGMTPLKFTYNISSEYLQNDYNTFPFEYNFMSPACVLPLEKGLGSGAVVDLIVPFLNGSAYQRSKYEPMKFTRMTYLYNRPE